MGKLEFVFMLLVRAFVFALFASHGFFFSVLITNLLATNRKKLQFHSFIQLLYN